MKVILLKDIKGFGRKFDIREAKGGYARNFLLPRGLAKPATDSAIKELESQKAVWQKEEQEIKNKLESLAKELEGKEFRFTLKTGKKKEVFGSVHRDEIKKAVLASVPHLSAFADDIEIKLEHPIKSLGEYSVEMDLSRGVKAKIKVVTEAEK